MYLFSFLFFFYSLTFVLETVQEACHIHFFFFFFSLFVRKFIFRFQYKFFGRVQVHIDVDDAAVVHSKKRKKLRVQLPEIVVMMLLIKFCLKNYEFYLVCGFLIYRNVCNLKDIIIFLYLFFS